jgi:hypothetical protein
MLPALANGLHSWASDKRPSQGREPHTVEIDMDDPVGHFEDAHFDADLSKVGPKPKEFFPARIIATNWLVVAEDPHRAREELARVDSQLEPQGLLWGKASTVLMVRLAG